MKQILTNENEKMEGYKAQFQPVHRNHINKQLVGNLTSFPPLNEEIVEPCTLNYKLNYQIEKQTSSLLQENQYIQPVIRPQFQPVQRDYETTIYANSNEHIIKHVPLSSQESPTRRLSRRKRKALKKLEVKNRLKENHIPEFDQVEFMLPSDIYKDNQQLVHTNVLSRINQCSVLENESKRKRKKEQVDDEKQSLLESILIEEDIVGELEVQDIDQNENYDNAMLMDLPNSQINATLKKKKKKKKKTKKLLVMNKQDGEQKPVEPYINEDEIIIELEDQKENEKNTMHTKLTRAQKINLLRKARIKTEKQKRVNLPPMLDGIFGLANPKAPMLDFTHIATDEQDMKELRKKLTGNESLPNLVYHRVEKWDKEFEFFKERISYTKPLLILDLNGVLIYRPNRRVNPILRPGLEDFLEYCFEKFNVVIWSSMQSESIYKNVNYIMPDYLDQVICIFTRKQCILEGPIQLKTETYKNLNIIWHAINKNTGLENPFNSSNTIIIDDSKTKVRSHLNNQICPIEFEGGRYDTELFKIISYFEKLFETKELTNRFNVPSFFIQKPFFKFIP